MSNDSPTYTLSELCILADLPVRTLRYYVQQGLLDRPEGETRAARYGARHLEQALVVKKWTAAGLSLERIRSILHGQEPDVPSQPRAPGSVEVFSHLMVADGLEVVIAPSRAGLSPQQVRQFVKGVMELYAELQAEDTSEDEPQQP